MDESPQRQAPAQGVKNLAACPAPLPRRVRRSVVSLTPSSGHAALEDIRIVHARLMINAAIENVAKLGYKMLVARGTNSDCAKIPLRVDNVLFILK